MQPLQHIARALTLLLLITLPQHTTHAAELRTLTNNGRELDYLIAFPNNFDASAPHPVLIALPPGDQSREKAQSALDRYWEAEGTARGWVIVTPIAPKGKSFHTGLERSIPFLIDEVARAVVIEGGRPHLAGVSNGGKSAFRVATEYPNRFASLTVLPGFPPDDRATLGLRSLNQLPAGVAMYVGEQDPTWLAPMRTVKQRLDAYGIPTTFEVWPASEHIVNIKGIELFDRLDAKRTRPAPMTSTTPTAEVPGSAPINTSPAPAPAASTTIPPAPAPTTIPGSSASAPLPAPAAPAPIPAPTPAPAPAPTAPAPAPAAERLSPIQEIQESNAIAAVLDDFHDAAAKADFNRYFDHFTPEAVFLGTDASERWKVEAFKAFAKPHFDSGKGWAYRSTDRTITICPINTPGNEVAWFDELLQNEKLGVTRGSGVLRKQDGQWRIAQYNLSIPIPNDLADETAKRIREARPATPTP
jgi:pimeloyl-ACP methyl ester carboxylesterase